MDAEPLVILCVDDDPDIRLIVELSLRLDPGMAVHMAESGAQALALLAQGLSPDMLLLDVNLPGLDGADLIAALRGASRRPPPVILLTAAVRSRDDPVPPAAGVLGVIAKPFDPLRLAEEIRDTLAAVSAR